MDLQPILSALKRQKLTCLLIMLEVALAFAIISNATFIIAQRVERISIDSGVTSRELVRIRTASLTEEDARVRGIEDTAALRQLAGVVSVAAIQQVPFGEASWNGGLAVSREQRSGYLNVSEYYDGGGMLTTLGLRLIAGRDFSAEEYVDSEDATARVVIITQSVAVKLWPGQSALGRAVYESDHELRVVGVVADLVRSAPHDPHLAYDSIIMPMRGEAYRRGQFVLRVRDEAQAAQVIAAARAVLHKLQPNRLLLYADTLHDLQDNYFRQDRVMAGLLLAAVVALLLVTALGIVGLASFWVQQRRRQIGIRRALGATRARIRHYFQQENLLIVSGGIVVGTLAAYLINGWLMRHYELPRLPLAYFPISVIAMLVLGQLAALAPALRAMEVSPALTVRGQ